MCGIAAIFGHNRAVDEQTVRELLLRMQHRGKQYDEAAAGPNWAVGTNRLPIVDPDHGRQPVESADRRFVAILNGEIYNHLELRAQLQLVGIPCRSLCDTEVVANAFQAWGTSCWALFDGQFAAVVVDRKNGNFHAARDPLGIKPLYFGLLDDALVLSSEISPLAVCGVRDIRALPAGHSFTNTSTGGPQTYDSPSALTPRGDAPGLREALEDAVSKRVQTKKPIAVFISGGVDSSLIAAIAQRQHPRVTAYTTGFPGSPDVRAATAFAKDAGLRLVTVPIEPEQFEQRYLDAIGIIESYSPNLVSAAVFSLALANAAARDGHEIALVGEGADELFFGYTEFRNLPPHGLQAARRRLIDELQNSQLQRWDRCGMRHTLEVRTPYLDSRVVSHAETQRHRNAASLARGIPKAGLREIGKHYLSSDVCAREKLPMDQGASFGNFHQLRWLVRCALERHLGKSKVASVFKNAKSPLAAELELNRHLMQEHFSALSAHVTQPFTKDDFFSYLSEEVRHVA